MLRLWGWKVQLIKSIVLVLLLSSCAYIPHDVGVTKTDNPLNGQHDTTVHGKWTAYKF